MSDYRKKEKSIQIRTYRAMMLLYASYTFLIIAGLNALSFILAHMPYPYPIWFSPAVVSGLFILYCVENTNKIYFTKEKMYYHMRRASVNKTLTLYKKDIQSFQMMSKDEILHRSNITFDTSFKSKIQSHPKENAKFIIFMLKNKSFEWIDVSAYQLNAITYIGAVLAVYWDLDEYRQEDIRNE